MRQIDDGFGNRWLKCWRPWCGLEVVRPGKVQCYCDSRRRFHKSPPASTSGTR